MNSILNNSRTIEHIIEQRTRTIHLEADHCDGTLILKQMWVLDEDNEDITDQLTERGYERLADYAIEDLYDCIKQGDHNTSAYEDEAC